MAVRECLVMATPAGNLRCRTCYYRGTASPDRRVETRHRQALSIL